jgi:hypothetical protein
VKPFAFDEDIPFELMEKIAELAMYDDNTGALDMVTTRSLCLVNKCFRAIVNFQARVVGLHIICKTYSARCMS